MWMCNFEATINLFYKLQFLYETVFQEKEIFIYIHHEI